MQRGMRGQGKGGMWGGTINNKDLLKSHMEIYCRGFLKCIHIWKEFKSSHYIKGRQCPS